MRFFALMSCAAALKVSKYAAETSTWDLLKIMESNHDKATTAFEEHEAETDNLGDWRDMRSKCATALDSYMNEQYPNIAKLLNSMVEDDTSWFTQAMAFDATHQISVDMAKGSNQLKIEKNADQGGEKTKAP